MSFRFAETLVSYSIESEQNFFAGKYCKKTTEKKQTKKTKYIADLLKNELKKIKIGNAPSFFRPNRNDP